LGSGTCTPFSPGTAPTYNGRRHIERCDFSRHDPIIPPRTLPAGGQTPTGAVRLINELKRHRILLLDRVCVVRAMVATGLLGHLIAAG
jgi:hypothetical protein